MAERMSVPPIGPAAAGPSTALAELAEKSSAPEMKSANGLSTNLLRWIN
jgi:hypothetical protein